MQYWINKDSDSNNLLVLNQTHLLYASVKEADITEIETALKNGAQPAPPLLETNEVSLAAITDLKSTNADAYLTLKSTEEKDELELSFESEADKADFLAAFKSRKPAQLTEHIKELNALTASFWPLVSLACALIAAWLFINKFPVATYIVAGLWACLSLYTAVQRIRKPPVITRWSDGDTGVSGVFDFVKQGFALSLVMAALITGANAVPDARGASTVLDSAAKGFLNTGNIDNMIAAGGDLDQRDQNGHSALFLMIDQADTRAYEVSSNLLASALINKASQSNSSNTESTVLSSTLMAAASGMAKIDKSNANEKLSNEAEKTAIALIELGADVNLVDVNGVTPLQFALETYADNALSYKLFNALLAAGASTDIQVGYDKLTPLQYVKSADFGDTLLAKKSVLLELLQEHQASL